MDPAAALENDVRRLSSFSLQNVEINRCLKANATMEKPDHLGISAAENVAVGALAWLAGEPEALGRFLALAGIGPQSLRQAAAEPGFLLGVLDFLMGDERLVTAYAAHADLPPRAIAAARMALGGPDIA
jgi:hypothetical protein